MNRHQALVSKSRWWSWFVLLLVLAAGGCGKNDKGKVSGTVTYQGKPLPSANVSFVDFSNQPLGSAVVQEGKYRMSAPLPVGPVKVAVKTSRHSRRRRGIRSPQLPSKGKSGVPSPSPSTVSIPPQYGDPEQSGLTYTVQPGEQVYNIDLE